MRLWFHRYELTPRRALSSLARAGAREGALLRTEDGFADLHPWPELGDLPLEEQLALLAREEPTAQALASLRLARADGDARRRGVSLFEGLVIPDSHWPGADPPQGFDTVKIKGVEPVPAHVRIRIDFNGTLTANGFVRLAETLPKSRVDFVEDPCPYDAATWRELRQLTGLRLAIDRYEGDVADVVVHKPALRADLPAFDREVVVTSYMDHPVGQLGAAWVAATHAVSRRCGLMTHELYEPDPFVERMRRDGARLVPPAGTGVGFDDLLAKLPWKALA
jgi:O-succinylbenzoate synthase